MGLEYYYLFGLDIPLDRFELGKVSQPKLKDFIENNITLEEFYFPFIYVDYLLGKMKDEDEIEEIKKELDRLGKIKFLILTCKNSENKNILNMLINSLRIIYKSDNIYVTGDLKISIDDRIYISDDNFESLTKVLMESIKVDKSKLKFKDEEEEYDGRLITKEMLEAKKRFLEKNKKKEKDGLTILDIANIVIHFSNLDYNKVLNMTVYQIKNSYEFISRKESFDIQTLYRISPKFDMSNETYEHWTDKIKLDKSSLSQSD